MADHKTLVERLYVVVTRINVLEYFLMLSKLHITLAVLYFENTSIMPCDNVLNIHLNITNSFVQKKSIRNYILNEKVFGVETRRFLITSFINPKFKTDYSSSRTNISISRYNQTSLDYNS